MTCCFLPTAAPAAGALGLALTLLAALPAASEPPGRAAPATLAGTGLYVEGKGLEIDPRHLSFAPQYPLWTDGAGKRRWISLPPGTAIDAGDPDAWVFPVGTRLWKEFSFAGRRVETRYIERLGDGSWLYAAYAWSADERTAVLVSERGRRDAFPLGDDRAHAIPGTADCKVCHEGGRSPVLGFSALQLSPDRDAQALHGEAPGIDLAALIDGGLLVGWPRSRPTPRIAAASLTERSALGYLHGNCGHCHNHQGSLRNLGLFLRHEVGADGRRAVASTVAQPVRKPAPGQSADAVLRVAPRKPDRSALLQRMASRYPLLQMPPLGTELIDDDAVALIRRWIDEMTASGNLNTPQQKKGS